MASISACLAVTASDRRVLRPSFFRGHALPFCRRLPDGRLGHALRFRNRKDICLPVRAGLQASADFKPGARVESDRLPSVVRKRAMEAIESSGGRVTIGDVASRAGLKLDEAERALQAIASDTGGFLEVSDEGDVLYVFPRDYRSKLAAKSVRMRVEPLLEKSKAVAEYLVRVSFGTALIVSIVLVYTTIIALVSSRSDDDGRGRRERGYNPGFSFYFRPSDLFWYWDPYFYRRRQMRTDDGMNFVESVFSFVFGDGDPNQGIEEERWKLVSSQLQQIGQYISSNGGTVTAEELAPYLDVLPVEETKEDESFILPVLLRFDGYPEVDDKVFWRTKHLVFDLEVSNGNFSFMLFRI
ncbi:Uncharacterized protein EJ110_NYTH58673 [Nymphaea thermarum]|nr:Uncharacterized protein EJ110_NYTH58673 [Nymphaea thermarum]